MRPHLQEPVHCPDPGLQCPTRSRLRVHRLREAGEKVHRCHLCDFSAVERNAIRRHVVSVHAHSAVAHGASPRHTYPCPSCGLRFHQSRSLKAHMKTHNVPRGSNSAACVLESCSFQISSHKELLRHILEVHGVRAVECRYHACGAVFRTEAEMLVHYQSHRAYHCPQCEFSCSNKALFLRHQRSGHAGPDKLSCDFCSFFTFNPVQYERHVKRCHPNEKIHRCSQCSYATSHRRSLKRHALTHSGEKPHKCGLCDFRCRDESYLSRHMLTHSDDKNFMCSDCGYVTKWKHYLTVHMRKHAGDMRHQCDQCSYRCHRVDQLKSHKLRHQAKSLICEICAFACKRKYELRSHMTSKHAGDEGQPSVHRCAFCTYTTRYRQALRNHENCQHTRLKEFHCALCSYVSFSTVSLFLHKRKAHGYVPGDQRWLDSYAAKEKERSSTQEATDFYRKSFTAKQLEKNAEGERGPQGEQAEPPNAADLRKQTETKNMKSVGALDDEPQEGGDKSLTGSSDEFCTLIFTPVSTNTTLRNEGESFLGQTGTPSHSDALKENEELPRSACLSGEEEEKEEEETSVNEECDSSECVSQETPELVGRTLSPNAGSGFTCVQNQPMSQKKRTNCDQTEASVLDGQVDETDRASAAQVETQGLDGRIPNQSPGFSEKRPTGGEHCSKGDEGSENPTPGTDSSQTKPSSERQATAEAYDQELYPLEISSSSLSAAETQIQQQSVDTRTGRRFRCELCSFTSLRPTAFQRHVTACRKRVHQTDSWLLFAGDHGWEEESDRAREGDVEGNMSTAQERVSSDRSSAPKKTVRREERERVETGEVNSSTSTETSNPDRSPALRSRPVQKRRTALRVELKHRGAALHRRHVTRLASVYTGRHTCKTCGKTFGSFAKLHRHRANEHEKQPALCCPLCDFRGHLLDDLRRHQQQSHTGLEEETSNNSGTPCQLLALPVEQQHEEDRPEDKTLACSRCSFACCHPPVMERHLRSHGGRGAYKCADCEYSTGNRQKMTRHIRTHTGEKPYGCRLCTYTCADPSRLKLHLRVHQEEKKFLCPDCGYRCKWSSQLKYHMTRHTGEKSYACGECDYRTNRADALRAHRDTQHCDLRPYVCEKCGKAFKTRFLLNTHQRQHSDARLYTCGLCPKAFRWPAGLRHHFLSHTNQQPFSCARCSYRARQKFQVVKHLRRHHPEVSVEEGVVKQTGATSLTLKEALQGRLGEEGEKSVDAGEVQTCSSA